MKVRIILTAVAEYEQNPEWYPGCKTPEEMLAIDVQATKDDIHSFIDLDSPKITVKGEIVP